MPVPRRLSAAAALAVAAAAATAGCTATNPQSTGTLKNPGDGTDVDLGPVHVASLIVVADAAGAGNLVARLVNSNTAPEQVTITDAGTSGFSRTFSVPGSSTVAVGPGQDQSVAIASVGEPAGAIVDYTIDVAGTGQRTVPVPVLDGTLQEYRTLVPTPTATSTPTSSATSSATAAPTSSAGSGDASSSPGRSSRSRAAATATASGGVVTQTPSTEPSTEPASDQSSSATG